MANLVQCPECQKEIDHLRNFSPCWREFELTVSDGEGRFEETENPIGMDNLGDDYDCPECGATLFHHAEDAISFLKGG